MITILRNYQQKTTPFTHQQCEFDRSKNMPYYAGFWEMGTGKSKLIIDTVGHLYCSREIDGVILVGDKGNYRIWLEEIRKHLPDDINRRIAIYSSNMSRKEQESLSKVLVAQDDTLDFLIVNIESFISDNCCSNIQQFIANHYCLMCIDEATSIKNNKAQRTKAAISLGSRCDYRRILTGTPITQSPLDVFAMCQFLKPGVLNFNNFTAFKNFYAIQQRINLGPNRPSFDKVIGFRHLDLLSESLTTFSSRITKDECLDLPPKIYETVHVELSDEQRQHYDNLRDTAVLQLKQGLLTVTSALTMINKLQQICCGHIKLDGDIVHDLDNNRTAVLLDTIESIGKDHKIVVWCAFQRDVELVSRTLRDAGITHVTYYGKTNDHERILAIESFTKYDAQVFVGTQLTGGKGLTLTVANYVIYYSNNYSLEDRLQSEDRAHRIGQTSKVTYIDLVTPRTVDEKILENHKNKKDLANEVLSNIGKLLEVDDLQY